MPEQQMQQPINEMARFVQGTTGLPMIIWLTPNEETNTGQHNVPRLRFQDNTSDHFNPNDMIPISIHQSEPMILAKDYQTKLPNNEIAKLKQWIVQNYDILLQYWNGEIYEDILMRDVKPYDNVKPHLG